MAAGLQQLECLVGPAGLMSLSCRFLCVCLLVLFVVSQLSEAITLKAARLARETADVEAWLNEKQQ